MKRRLDRTSLALCAAVTIVTINCSVGSSGDADSSLSPYARQQIQFSLLIGGSGFDSIRDVAVDDNGNTYVTGGTTSKDFMVTSGALQAGKSPGRAETSRIDPFDVFVTKIDSKGQLVWSTYLGGPNYDRAYAIEVDGDGFVYVGGRAGRGFPVTAGSAQTTFMGGAEADFYGPQDGFVAKISPDGGRIVWATYFGAADDPSIVRDLAIDQQRNVYIASGYRSGARFPPGVESAMVNKPLGGRDALVAKISADGSHVVWGRYAGGTDDDFSNGSVRVSPDGAPHLLFTTRSSGIATEGVWGGAYGGNGDMCVARLNAQTGALEWTTYIAGNGNESTETHEFAGFDPEGNVYVSGPTTSTNFPATPGAFGRSFHAGPAGSNDVFVVKFSGDGRKLLAATYVGGAGNDRTEGAAVGIDGTVYLTGTTTSRDFPITPEAAQPRLHGDRDLFLLKMSTDLKTLVYSSYYGGKGVEFGRTAAVDRAGNFVSGGETNSSDWPAIAGKIHLASGAGDGFVLRMTPGLTPGR